MTHIRYSYWQKPDYCEAVAVFLEDSSRGLLSCFMILDELFLIRVIFDSNDVPNYKSSSYLISTELFQLVHWIFSFEISTALVYKLTCHSFRMWAITYMHWVMWWVETPEVWPIRRVWTISASFSSTVSFYGSSVSVQNKTTDYLQLTQHTQMIQ